MPSNVGVMWSPNLDELKRQWATMADRLAGEADHRAEEAAQGAAVAIRTVYAQHWVTGNLVKRVVVSRWHRGKLLPGWAVISRAPHTWLFEHGSVARRYVSKRGKVHNTGAMWHGSPPPPTFYPTVNTFRRQLEREIIALMMRADVPGLVSVTTTGG
jgi:hypothetical protein